MQGSYTGAGGRHWGLDLKGAMEMDRSVDKVEMGSISCSGRMCWWVG